MMRIIGWPEEEAFAVYSNTRSKSEYDNAAEKMIIFLTIMGESRVEVYIRGYSYTFLKAGDWSELKEGDIVQISQKGYINILYKNGQSEIDLFLTNKCNSNCVMCPLTETIRKKNKTFQYKWIMDFLEILPPCIPFINITGGEPTFEVRYFLDIMFMLKNKFHHSEFQLLTNGRSFSDCVFLDNALVNMPKHVRFAIPIHACDAELHDLITQAKGSFEQTEIGIKNLLKREQKVEIRIVVTKLNLYSIRDTVQYIVKHFKNVYVVTFIGVEMMGNAVVNKDIIWEDYSVILREIRNSIIYLVENAIDTQLYNFPLCAMDRGLWPLAAKSITPYKVRYKEECNLCEAKSLCGGLFASTMNVIDPEVRAIQKL